MKDSKIGIKFTELLTALLTVLFVGLKLTNHIDWSWWWVLAPLWIGLAIGVLVLIIVLFLYFTIK